MNTIDPFVTIQQIAGGYCLNRCLHVVAELGVADILDDAPKSSEEIAGQVGANPPALGRVLRLLSAHGIFEASGKGFSHSPASRLLRKDHPQSMKGFVRMFGLPINWKAYEVFGEAVRTGEPVMGKVYQGGLWQYYSEHREESRIFNDAMADKAKGQIQGIMACYDFSRFNTVGDIGGGRGHLLQAVLNSAPHAQGVLFDLPHVIEEASAIASDRLYLQSGDFFIDDLPACDAYLVMEIVHDWGQEEAEAILRAIKKAAPPHAKLLLIETIIPETADPDWSKMLDIHMLTLLGGQQRTRKEYESLLAAAGFSLDREVDTGAGISILEASLS